MSVTKNTNGNGSVPSSLQSYTIPKERTIGCTWKRRSGQWYKYWRRDFGGFFAEMPAYFTSYSVHYTGRPFDE